MFVTCSNLTSGKNNISWMIFLKYQNWVPPFLLLSSKIIFRASFLHHYFKEHKMEAESDTSSSYLKKVHVASKLSERKPTTNPLSVNQQFSKNRWVKLQNVSSSGSVYVPEDTRQSCHWVFCYYSFDLFCWCLRTVFIFWPETDRKNWNYCLDG